MAEKCFCHVVDAQGNEYAVKDATARRDIGNVANMVNSLDHDVSTLTQDVEALKSGGGSGDGTAVSNKLYRIKIKISVASEPEAGGQSDHTGNVFLTIYTSTSTPNVDGGYLAGGVYAVSGTITVNPTNTNHSALSAEIYTNEIYVKVGSGGLFGFNRNNGDSITYIIDGVKEV